MRFKALVFGSGGTAKEVIGYLESEGHWDIVGVVSSEPFNNRAYDKYPFYSKAPDIEADYILAVANPAVKRKIVAENKDRWVTFWHQSCHISEFAKIGKGCIFMPCSMATGDAIIGDFVTYNIYAQSGHDCVIGDYTTFSPYAETCGGCVVGEDVFFGVRAVAIPKINIASGAKISAGAVVRHSILEPITVYGDPAKPRDIEGSLLKKKRQ